MKCIVWVYIVDFSFFMDFSPKLVPNCTFCHPWTSKMVPYCLDNFSNHKYHGIFRFRGVWDNAKHYLGWYYQFCHFFIDFITRLAHSDINGRQTLIFSKKRKKWFFLANIHKITWKEPVTREFYLFSLYSPLLLE